MNKVPQVTLAFWIIKILATTLGETGGDTLSMSFNLGYAASTGIFFVLFAITVLMQIRSRAFHPFMYWLVVVATTLTGTTIADFADRSLGIGYPGGTLILFTLVVISLASWRFATGSISVSHINSAKNESFYWVTILFSNTLGTALGDFLADDTGLGFSGGALFFGALIAGIAALYFFTKLSRTWLFWAAFILTRPLGATLGDLLTKPVSHGGFNLSRPDSSAVIAVCMVAAILITWPRGGAEPGKPAMAN
jgi:uncharacterized membrane-anchored protein